MKKAFPQILALIACVLLTACGAGNNCIGYNGCSDSATTTTTTPTTTTTTTTPTTTTTTTTTVLSSVVSTLAGDSTVFNGGFADGTGTAAKFKGPNGLVVDSSGNVYVADQGNHRIRKITSDGVVTTFAGSGTSGSADGTGTAATFNNPQSITIDSSGNFYVTSSFTVRKITSAGVVTTFAGSGTSGSADGTGTAATFNNPQSITIDSSGNFYVTSSFTVRKITSAGVVTTFAGSGTSGSADGTGTAASFGGVGGIAIDSSNNLYVADVSNHTIRKITSAGVVTTFAGRVGIDSSVDGTGTAASFSNPQRIAIDSSGNLYVNEYYRVRKITSAAVVTTLAGSGTNAYANGTGTAASFSVLGGAAVDSSGNVYVVDNNGHTVRQITSAGVVTTFAGSANTSGTTNGTLTASRFKFPQGITIDSSGNLYVSESQFGSNTIRKILIIP